MKTSKLIYIFLCVLPFTSCQQEEIESPVFSKRPILFSHITMEASASTRSDDNKPVSGEFPADATVGVLGYCKTVDGAGATTNWANKKQNCVPFMPDMQTTPTSTELTGVKLTKQLSGDWTYSPLYTWYENDNEYKYSFFAYSPCDPTYFTISTLNYTGTQYRGAPKASFHLPYPNNNETEKLNRNLLRDGMLSNNIDHQSSEGNVSFQFYHITAGLRFSVNNFDDKDAVTISSLSLSGTFNKQMTIEAQTNYEVMDTYKGTFTIADASMTVEPQGFDRFFTEGGVQDANKITLLLIPNLETDGITPTMGAPGHTPMLNITYQMGTEQSVTTSLPLPKMNYTVGVIHNISLDFLGNSLTLTATPMGWDNEYTSDIVFE